MTIPPTTSYVARELYNILTHHVVLVSVGMGVSFRESRSGLSDILKEHGIEYIMVKPFIDDLEYRLMHQYAEEVKK